MSEQVAVHAAVKTADATRRGVETLIKKAWSVMDAVSEKRRPTEYLSGRAVQSIRGEGT